MYFFKLIFKYILTLNIKNCIFTKNVLKQRIFDVCDTEVLNYIFFKYIYIFYIVFSETKSFEKKLIFDQFFYISNFLTLYF